MAPATTTRYYEYSDEEEDDQEDDMMMTPEQRETYWKMVEESSGFEVPDFPPGLDLGQIAPIKSMRGHMKDLKFCCQLAIEHYKQEEGKEIKFVKILKANGQICAPINYYITFEAKDLSGKVDVYQALVHLNCDSEKSEVGIMRLRPETGNPTVTRSSSCSTHCAALEQPQVGHHATRTRYGKRKRQGSIISQQPILCAAPEEKPQVDHHAA
ncbi:hypothetical protein CDL15_Pgr023903 [Punica granatum]|uniref:Cystatin domain-containing protein n=1 Tax=Punica granatum TaxID=22663 RepID=A0A218XVI6_PUNGR|nr:hypothetical protein CDL15_Pgr023903 [Punica granatum]PKI52637.1 hypothetical protein CRG98_026977 [Punica granatum]